jgi:WD40 repeat protein
MHPNGNELATVTNRGCVLLYDMRCNKRIKELNHKTDSINCIYSASGRYLIMDSPGSTLQIWDSVADDYFYTPNEFSRLPGYSKLYSDNMNKTIVRSKKTGIIEVWDATGLRLE